MDKDGNVRVSWEEWRDFLLLQPHTSMKDIFRIWSHATVEYMSCSLPAFPATGLHREWLLDSLFSYPLLSFFVSVCFSVCLFLSLSLSLPSQFSNIGEAMDSVLMPDDFSEEERVSGMWWRQLVAGGGAGAGENI